MRILLVTTDYLPNVSGIATLSHEQAIGLASRGHNVRVLTTTAAGSFNDTVFEQSHNLEINRETVDLPPIIRLASFIKRVRQAVIHFQPEFIWCTNYRGFGLPVHAVARKKSIPYGIYFHGTELITEARSSLRKTLLHRVAGGAAVVCTNSRNSANLLHKIYGIQATVATPGVHKPEDLHEPEAKVQQFRDEWLKAVNRSANNTTIFIAACRISRQKGLHSVLEAIAKLEPAMRGQMMFVAVGSGPDHHELIALADNLKISQCVHFHGPAARSDIPSLLQAADVYLQPSQPESDFLESFGISFLEAQSVGLPCIATRWGGIPEAVKEGETAILVEPGSVDQISMAIKRAISDLAWRTSAAENAVAWARENSWSNHVITVETQMTAAKSAFSHAR